jgi:hypothetical protein
LSSDFKSSFVVNESGEDLLDDPINYEDLVDDYGDTTQFIKNEHFYNAFYNLTCFNILEHFTELIVEGIEEYRVIIVGYTPDNPLNVELPTKYSHYMTKILEIQLREKKIDADLSKYLQTSQGLDKMMLKYQATQKRLLKKREHDKENKDGNIYENKDGKNDGNKDGKRRQLSTSSSTSAQQRTIQSRTDLSRTLNEAKKLNGGNMKILKREYLRLTPKQSAPKQPSPKPVVSKQATPKPVVPKQPTPKPKKALIVLDKQYKIKELKEVAKNNNIKLSKKVDGKYVALNKKELITTLNKRKLI